MSDLQSQKELYAAMLTGRTNSATVKTEVKREPSSSTTDAIGHLSTALSSSLQAPTDPNTLTAATNAMNTATSASLTSLMNGTMPPSATMPTESIDPLSSLAAPNLGQLANLPPMSKEAAEAIANAYRATMLNFAAMNASAASMAQQQQQLQQQATTKAAGKSATKGRKKKEKDESAPASAPKKRKPSGDDDEDGDDGEGGPIAPDTKKMKLEEGGNTRYDSSLGLLTKKFVELLQSAQSGGILDLNEAAKKLGVQKRRIYDITNVLEGIGLIQKKSKNNIQWKGTNLTSMIDLRRELNTMKDELEALNLEESTLDDYIQHMQDTLKHTQEYENNSAYCYMTHEDIMRVENFQEKIIIAIKAPKGTTLDVPPPADSKKDPSATGYQAILKSAGGPIDVYVVSNGVTEPPPDQSPEPYPSPFYHNSAANSPLHQPPLSPMVSGGASGHNTSNSSNGGANLNSLHHSHHLSAGSNSSHMSNSSVPNSPFTSGMGAAGAAGGSSPFNLHLPSPSHHYSSVYGRNLSSGSHLQYMLSQPHSASQLINGSASPLHSGASDLPLSLMPSHSPQPHHLLSSRLGSPSIGLSSGQRFAQSYSAHGGGNGGVGGSASLAALGSPFPSHSAHHPTLSHLTGASNNASPFRGLGPAAHVVTLPGGASSPFGGGHGLHPLPSLASHQGAGVGGQSQNGSMTYSQGAMLKLEPPSNDPDYFMNLDDNEGLTDLYSSQPSATATRLPNSSSSDGLNKASSAAWSDDSDNIFASVSPPSIGETK